MNQQAVPPGNFGTLGGTSTANVADALRASRTGIICIALLSGVINVLMLTGSIFMMQVYDRVLTSQSVPTLIALAGVAIGAYLFLGLLDGLRARLLMLSAERIDGRAGPLVFRSLIGAPQFVQRDSSEPLQPMRDLENVRSFAASQGPAALFDLPWVPLYVGVVYLLHPYLGLTVIVGALLMIFLTLLNSAASKPSTLRAMQALSVRNNLADRSQAGAEAIRAMGMTSVLNERWAAAQGEHLSALRRSGFIAGGFTSTARMLRMILQSAVLGLGAYLAILGEISAGTIIAGCILGSRALAPIDQTIASWRALTTARQSYRRLKQRLSVAAAEPKRFNLPPPKQSLETIDLTMATPDMKRRVFQRLAFKLTAGQGLGILGPSAAGKSTLARALVGLWPPQSGKVLLDGASIDQWSCEQLGPHIGYMPQDIQLFDGSVAENIARFMPDPDPEAVIEAARLAGFHEQILEFEDGYDTVIGKGANQLSAGQRQKLGLARALFGDPFLVVLDEPNSNLDFEGEKAVVEAMHAVRRRGGIVVAVAHRQSTLAAVDHVLVLYDGIGQFGPRDTVLAERVRNVAGKPLRPRDPPLTVVETPQKKDAG